MLSSFSPAHATDIRRPDHVVVVGVGGLQPADISRYRTPEIWAMAIESSAGAISVRSVRSYACPADGWLAISTGTRAADLPGNTYGECRTLRNPTNEGTVPGWTDYQTAADNDSFNAKLGLLNESLTQGKTTVAAIGPGAAIATATPDGNTIENYHARPSDSSALGTLVSEVAPTSQLLVIDAGEIRSPGRETVNRLEPLTEPVVEPAPEETAGIETPAADEDLAPGDPEDPVDPDITAPQALPTRAEQAREINDRVGAIMKNLPDDTFVIFSSLSDSGTISRLQFAATTMVSVPATVPAEKTRLLRSSSTRQDGILQTTDIFPTLAEQLDLPRSEDTKALPGGVLRYSDNEFGPWNAVRKVQDIAGAAAYVHPRVGDFFNILTVASLALMALVAATWKTRWLDQLILRVRPKTKLRNTWTNLARWIAIPLSAIPVSTTLANLLPWLRIQNPLLGLTGAIAIWVALITAAALLGPWRRTLLGSLTVVATVTALTLAIDVATGATLQISNLMGVQPIVAGRFYGFSNNSFPLFATALVFLTAIAAQYFIARGRKALAVTTVALIGIAATLFVGTPGLGSDFGGTPSLIPGFAIMAILVAGVRVSWRKLILIGAGTGAAMVAFCFVDWLRPPTQRTHLGRFFQTVLDGGVFSVIQRKLSQNLSILTGSWLTVLTVAGIVFAIFVLLRRSRWGIAPLPMIAKENRGLFAALIGWATMMGIGLLVNDSGILVPALGIILGLPMLIEICARYLRDAPESQLLTQ